MLQLKICSPGRQLLGNPETNSNLFLDGFEYLMSEIGLLQIGFLHQFIVDCLKFLSESGQNDGLMPRPSAWKKIIFVEDKPIFVPDNIKIVQDKEFCPRLKNSYLLGKRIENDLVAVEKLCPWLKSHFPIISQTNLYFFSLGQDFLSGTKFFVRDQRYFVRAEGGGKSTNCLTYLK